MGEILKITEEWRVDTVEEAEALIDKAKNEATNYDLNSYKMVKKDKKSKGEIIESWVVVTLVKVYE